MRSSLLYCVVVNKEKPEDKGYVGDGMGAGKIKVKVKIKEWVCGVHISLLKMFCHIRN